MPPAWAATVWLKYKNRNYELLRGVCAVDGGTFIPIRHLVNFYTTMKKYSVVNRPLSSDELLLQAFAKLDKVALGLAFGLLAGVVIFGATIVLVLKGGDVVGPNLGLLGQFFVGYSVTVTGSLVGLAYGFVNGFVFGWLMAFLHNLFIRLYFYLVHLKANVSSISDYIDPDHS